MILQHQQFPALLVSRISKMYFRTHLELQIKHCIQAVCSGSGSVHGGKEIVPPGASSHCNSMHLGKGGRLRVCGPGGDLPGSQSPPSPGPGSVHTVSVEAPFHELGRGDGGALSDLEAPCLRARGWFAGPGSVHTVSVEAPCLRARL